MSNKLVLTRSALDAPKNLAEVFELEPFRAAFANNYLKTTGKSGGEMIFEREKILFLKALQENKQLADCDRFTIYSSFVELAVSGLTLQDGQAFIIPYSKKAQFQIGWRGRLEQIQQIPIVNWVNTPILVYTSELDDFDYEYREGATTIIRHKPNKKRDPDDVIEFVYLTIETSLGVKTHLMRREEVLAIRDRYSIPYKKYIADCEKTGTPIGKPIKKKGDYGDYFVDPPFWVTDEAQAFKKTLVKRVYKELPKTARMKALDSKIDTNYDPEDATGGEETHEIEYGLADDAATTTQAEAPAPTPPAGEKTPKAKKEKIPASPNDSPQVTEMKKQAETLKANMKEKGQIVDEGTGEVTEDVSHSEVTDDNPVNDLPDLNNI
jgi:recombinational DNA repair protein RecT